MPRQPVEPTRDPTVSTADNEFEEVEQDREFRLEVVAEALRSARERNLILDKRSFTLLDRYIDGELTDVELIAEVKRPYLH